jgi:hypothetical protein
MSLESWLAREKEWAKNRLETTEDWKRENKIQVDPTDYRQFLWNYYRIIEGFEYAVKNMVEAEKLVLESKLRGKK